MHTIYESKEQCCGCNACRLICPVKAISMIPDNEGFTYPHINQDICVNCGRCKKVCPIINISTRKSHNILKVFAFKHKDINVLLRSSSGGAFTAISDTVLDNNGKVCGAVYDNVSRVKHVIGSTKTERNNMCGSKYLQSNLEDIYAKINLELEKGTQVLFTGTPCQIAGLNGYLNGKNADNLITVDLLCHGVVSPKLFLDYIQYVEINKKKKIIRHECRGKHCGWGHCERNFFDDGTDDYKSRFSQLHKRLFYSNLALRPSCYKCPFTSLNRESDITIADFWGIDKEIPSFCDKNGVSLILSNTSKGNKIINEINIYGSLHEATIEQAIIKQPHLQRPVQKPYKRENFWDIYLKQGYYHAIKYAFYRPVHEWISDLLKKIRLYNFLESIKKLDNIFSI